MTLTDDALATLAQLAADAALAAGRYVAATRPSRVERKDGGGSLAAQVVTEVDRASQQILLDTLAPSLERYDLAMLSEERPDDGGRLEKDHFWCIDPIDGTLCFVDDRPGYAVSVALVSRAGAPLIGVVHDPVNDVLYRALRGHGAWRNGVAWHPDLSARDHAPTVFTDSSELARPTFAAVAADVGAKPGAQGGAVMNAVRCLEAPPACYFKQTKATPGGGCFWDFAATACLYREVGAWVSDVAGAPLELNRRDSLRLNHCGVLYATNESLARRVIDAVARHG
ncbi:MAG: inositol monophosphatase family protein [Pseudomonadota bacterium]